MTSDPWLSYLSVGWACGVYPAYNLSDWVVSTLFLLSFIQSWLGYSSIQCCSILRVYNLADSHLTMPLWLDALFSYWRTIGSDSHTIIIGVNEMSHFALLMMLQTFPKNSKIAAMSSRKFSDFHNWLVWFDKSALWKQILSVSCCVGSKVFWFDCGSLLCGFLHPKNFQYCLYQGGWWYNVPPTSSFCDPVIVLINNHKTVSMKLHVCFWL